MSGITDADDTAATAPFGRPWTSRRQSDEPPPRIRPEQVLGLSTALIVHGLFGFWLLLARPGESPENLALPGTEAVFIDMSNPVVAPPPPIPQPPTEVPPPPRIEKPEPVPEPIPESEALDTPPPAQEVAQVDSVVAPVAAPSAADNTASAAPSPAVQPAVAIDLTGVQTGPLNEWQITLLQHLHQHLRYPLQARRRHQQGVTLVRFVIDRRGHLQSALLEDSSGHELLDEEALAVLARAQPLPPPPASVAGGRIEIVVPISYRLRRS